MSAVPSWSVKLANQLTAVQSESEAVAVHGGRAMTPTVRAAANLYTQFRAENQNGLSLAAADNLVALLAGAETERELSALALQIEFALESKDVDAVGVALDNLVACALPLLASPRIDADARLAYGQIVHRAWMRSEGK